MKPSSLKPWITDAVLLACLLCAALTSVIAVYMVFWQTPNDYLQGEYFKILYIHVPAAWLSLGLYVILAVFSALYLVFLNPLYDILARSCAAVGMMYTALTLVTGAIWGKPTWGVWWVWDARLTSMLILLFIYMAYMMLHSHFRNEQRAAKTSAVFALIGLINIPIIKLSVYAWSTLHQKSTFFRVSPTIHSSMVPPLVVMLISLLLWTAFLVGMKIRSELIIRKSSRLRHIENIDTLGDARST